MTADFSLYIAMLFFAGGFGYTLYALWFRTRLPVRFNFYMLLGAFAGLTWYLTAWGKLLGRCPLTNLSEILIFLSWSLVLIYMIVGGVYRVSLMGAFTGPLGLLLAVLGLWMRGPVEKVVSLGKANFWLELHGAFAIIAHGAFALAGVSAVMFLVMQGLLKRRSIHSLFYRLPPISSLSTVNKRLLWIGVGLLSLGLGCGFLAGVLPEWEKLLAAWSVWGIYLGISLFSLRKNVSPRLVALLSICAFVGSMLVLWGIAVFVGQM